MRFRSAILWTLLLTLAAVPAHAENRVALVIGNKDYKASVGPLANPLNDIRLVSDALKSVGFEVQTPVENATRSDMLRAVYAFASSLRNAGPDAVGFLYYSGHGAASQGENYLIPIDVTEPSTEQLNIQGVKQSEVLKILRDEAPNAAHYLVLDACRNNLQGARGGKGFVAIGQQSGVLVAFSTEPGKTAQDTGSGSGPYAAALATELVKPGQTDLIMFHNVRIDVIDKTKRDQVPWFEDGIERRERPVFARGPDADKPAAAPPVATTSSEIERAWAAAQSTTSQAVLEDFIRRFGDSFYATMARARLNELKKNQIAVVAQPNQSDDTSVVRHLRHTFGIQVDNMSDSLRKFYKINESVRGVVITGVEPNSGAAEHRLSAGDVILEAGQEDITNTAELQKRIDTLTKDGKKSALLRVHQPNGVDVFVALPLSVVPPPVAPTAPTAKQLEDFIKEFRAPPPASVEQGLRFANMSETLRNRFGIADGIRGVVVVGVDRGSDEHRQGLVEGDVVVEVSEIAVGNTDDLSAGIDKLKRDGRNSALLRVVKPHGVNAFIVVRLR
jgi:uncharacterized caspase-like protein